MKIDKRIKKKLAAEKNLRVQVNQYGYLRCFKSKEEYREWVEAEKVVHTLRFRKNACEDCTSAHQSAMISVGKCANKDFLVKN